MLEDQRAQQAQGVMAEQGIQKMRMAQMEARLQIQAGTNSGGSVAVVVVLLHLYEKWLWAPLENLAFQEASLRTACKYTLISSWS